MIENAKVKRLLAQCLREGMKAVRSGGKQKDAFSLICIGAHRCFELDGRYKRPGRVAEVFERAIQENWSLWTFFDGRLESLEEPFEKLSRMTPDEALRAFRRRRKRKEKKAVPLKHHA